MYKLVLGLEIHLQLNTREKMFCGCSADVFGREPNTSTCPTCLGLPGALPVPNFEAVKKTQLLGLALDCELNNKSRFDRKHYFYPDLPKGYQISQYKMPLCKKGFAKLPNGKEIEVERIHLEEDTAKSFHEGNKTLVDFNKSGVPLVEIVTTPSIQTVEDAVSFSRKIQDMSRFIDVSDCDMEKGQMRLEANISLRTEEMEELGMLPDYKVEIKNINSFRFMEKAVRAEIKRQEEILTGGGTVEQENRGWSEKLGTTVSQRNKEEAHDYRYFPEPDIPPMVFDEKYFEQLSALLTTRTDEVKKAAEHKYEPFTRPEEKLNKEKELITDWNLINTQVQKIINDKLLNELKGGKIGLVEFVIGRVLKESSGKFDPRTVRKIVLELLVEHGIKI